MSGSNELHFVLGTGRCGSTLVHEVLCQHREVAFLSNLEDLGVPARAVARTSGRTYRKLPPWVTEKGRARFAPSEGYRALAREVSPIMETSVRDLVAADATPWLAGRLREFFGRRMAVAPEPVYLHKLTGWPRVGLLHAVFPSARYLHVIRDGRAVANSWLQMPWWLGYRGPEHWHWGPLSPEQQEQWERSGRSFVVLAGLAWVLLIEAFEQARSQLDAGAWFDLRYEDMLAEPEATFEKVLAFFGLPFDDDFRARLDRYAFSTGRTDAFRRDLGPEALAALEEVVGPTLERYGYA
jgi:hypothetical protein